MALKLIDEDWIDNKIADYVHMRDGWKAESHQYAAYDLMVRECRKIKSILQPLPESYSKEDLRKAFDGGRAINKKWLYDYVEDGITKEKTESDFLYESFDDFINQFSNKDGSKYSLQDLKRAFEVFHYRPFPHNNPTFEEWFSETYPDQKQQPSTDQEPDEFEVADWWEEVKSYFREIENSESLTERMNLREEVERKFTINKR